MGLFSTFANIYVTNRECVCARACVRGGYGAENLGEGDESGGTRNKERGKVDSRRNGEKFSTLHTYNLLYLIPQQGFSEV